MDQKEQQLRAELTELEAKLQDPAIYSDSTYPKLAKRKAWLEEVIILFDQKSKLVSDKTAAEELRIGEDAELAQMATAELTQLEAELAGIESRLVEALTPQDSN